MKLVIKALAFAADKHRNQRRKYAEASPYINYPIGLADVLANEAHMGDEHVLIAAILHDTIEDKETTEQELVRLFGWDVADLVLGVTDDYYWLLNGNRHLVGLPPLDAFDMLRRVTMRAHGADDGGVRLRTFLPYLYWSPSRASYP